MTKMHCTKICRIFNSCLKAYSQGRKKCKTHQKPQIVRKEILRDKHNQSHTRSYVSLKNKKKNKCENGMSTYGSWKRKS